MPVYNNAIYNSSVYNGVAAGSNLDIRVLPRYLDDLIIIAALRGADSPAAVEIVGAMNEDETDGNYHRQYMRAEGTSAPTGVLSNSRTLGVCPGSAATANILGSFVGHVASPAGRGDDPLLLVASGHYVSGSEAQAQLSSIRRNNVEKLTKIEFAPTAGGFGAGSIMTGYQTPKNIVRQKRLEVAGSDTVTLTDLPQNYRDLRVTIRGRVVSSGEQAFAIRYNADTSSKYHSQRLIADSTTVAAAQSLATGFATAGWVTSDTDEMSTAAFTVQEYARSDRHKLLIGSGGSQEDSGQSALFSMRYSSADPITSIQVVLAAGTWDADTVVTVEGVGESTVGWEDGQVAVTNEVVVDWSQTGNFEGTYDDISSDVTNGKVSGGRDVASALSGRVKASLLTLTLANDDDRYSPFNTGSALTGNLVPNRAVQVRCIAPVFRELFTGHIEKIEPKVTNRGIKTATLTCFGVFAELTQNEVNVAYAATKVSGAAVTAILDAAGQDSAARDIDTGEETFEDWVVDDIQAMTALRRTEESEPGLLREGRNGDFIFESRDHRMVLPRVIASAEYSDDPAAESVLRYETIAELDPLRFIFNDFRATVRRRATQAGIVLWTHPEANTTGDAPSILAGDSVEYWARYPNDASRTDAKGVAAWTALASTTDYLANAASNGTGTNLTSSVGVAEATFSRRKKITLTNNHASSTMYLTKLQNRGDALYELDPVGVRSSDSASITLYGQRTFNRAASAVWIPNTVAAQEWALYMLALHKDPSPMIRLGMTAQRSLYQAVDAVSREVSDRVGIEGDGNVGLGVNEDFFVEAYSYQFAAGIMSVTFDCSSAAAFSAFWTLGFSLLGSETRLNPA